MGGGGRRVADPQPRFHLRRHDRHRVGLGKAGKIGGRDQRAEIGGGRGRIVGMTQHVREGLRQRQFRAGEIEAGKIVAVVIAAADRRIAEKDLRPPPVSNDRTWSSAARADARAACAAGRSAHRPRMTKGVPARITPA
jgi:hypothetical protein